MPLEVNLTSLSSLCLLKFVLKLVLLFVYNRMRSFEPDVTANAMENQVFVEIPY